MQATPLAAFSSWGGMAEQKSMSETSLDGQSDMMDDISKICNDDHEMVRLVMTERDEGQLTSEESMVHLQENSYC